MKKREMTTAAGCKVVLEEYPDGTVAVVVRSANDGTVHAFALKAGDMHNLAALFAPREAV